MPVIRAEEVTITETELAQRAERLGVELPQAAPQITVNRVLQFIQESDNQDELKQVAIQSRKKLRDMGIVPRRKKASAFNRFVSRLATESAPIVFTIFVTMPLVMWSVFHLLEDIGFFRPYNCPPKCDRADLTILAVTSSLSVLFVYLTYAVLRKFFLKSRK